MNLVTRPAGTVPPSSSRAEKAYDADQSGSDATGNANPGGDIPLSSVRGNAPGDQSFPRGGSPARSAAPIQSRPGPSKIYVPSTSDSDVPMTSPSPQGPITRGKFFIRRMLSFWEVR